MRNKSRNSQAGFGLIIALIMVIVAGGLAANMVAKQDKESFWFPRTESQQDLTNVQNALVAFQRRYQRLPCVASRAVLPGGMGYGNEINFTAGVANCHTNSAAPAGTVRLNIGGGNFLRIGALPHNTLGLSANAGEDRWGNRFTYAVIEKLTDTAQFMTGTGAITVNDNANNPIMTDVAWVVVSHGPDAKGAVGAKGTSATKSCTGTLGKDQENCNDTNSVFRIADMDTTAGSNFYDDVIAYAAVDAQAQVTNKPCIRSTIGDASWDSGQCSNNTWTDMLHGDSGQAISNTNTTAATGSVTIGCNDGVLTYTGGICNAHCPSPLPAQTWTVDSCTGPVAGSLNHGASQSVANTASGRTGSVTVTCQDGALVQSAIVCNPASCIGTTHNWGASCTANSTTSAHGSAPTINNTTPSYSGSNTLLCTYGSWSSTGSTCTFTPPDCTATTLGWGAGCSANPGAMTHGQTINNVANSAASYSGMGNFSCNSGTMSVSGVTCILSCPDGYGSTRSVESACPADHSGTAYTTQTRANCGAAWVDGATDTSGCEAIVAGITCPNGASNHPTCSFAYVCTTDYQISGVSQSVVSYQSDTDDTGTTGDPNGPSGGDIITCCLGGACPAINGVCSDTPMTCDFGDPVSDGGQTACGTTHTWTCQGENGGTNSSCSIDNAACTVSCSTTGITGYASARVWNGPVSTPTYNVCTTGGVAAGNAFILTTDTAGSSWHAEVHKWNFTQGVASTQYYKPYDRKKKSTKATVYYDGSCSIYATAKYEKNSSNFKYAQIAITGINSCPPPSCTANGLPDDGNCCRADLDGDGLCGGFGGGGGGGCFLGDTKVILEDGSTKMISELELGERIQGKSGANTVRRLTKYTTNEAIYSINDGRAFVTAEHPFIGVNGKLYAIDPELTYVETHNGLKPNKLVKGVSIITRDSTIKVDTITETPAKKRTVYNVSVDGDLSYFADGYLMHNVGSDGGGFLGKAMVRMADGNMKPLSEIVKGDMVYGRHSVNRVETVQTHYTNDDVYNINDGMLLVAGEHLLMTNKGWSYIDSSKLVPEDKRNYRQLVVGDVLVLENKKTVTVDSIKPYQTEEILRGLVLDGDHTYYVNGVLVHNIMMRVEK